MSKLTSKTIKVYCVGCDDPTIILEEDIFDLEMYVDKTLEKTVELCRQCREDDQDNGCMLKPQVITLTFSIDSVSSVEEGHNA